MLDAPLRPLQLVNPMLDAPPSLWVPCWTPPSPPPSLNSWVSCLTPPSFPLNSLIPCWTPPPNSWVPCWTRPPPSPAFSVCGNPCWWFIFILSLYSKGSHTTTAVPTTLSPSLLNTCLSTEFRCTSGKCIDNQWKCDKQDDCGDGSDETGCPCRRYQLTCDNGDCVDKLWRCDGSDDCGDGTDERNCPASTTLTTANVTRPTTKRQGWHSLCSRNINIFLPFGRVTVVWCIELYLRIVLYCSVLYCTVLYCIVLCCSVLYCLVFHCTLLYCTILCCAELYCIFYCTVLYGDELYCIAPYCTVLYCIVMYCIVLYWTVLCFSMLYCIVLHCNM